MSGRAPWLAPLQAFLDRRLAASAQARELCRSLAGETLALEFSGLNLTLYLQTNESGVSISNVYADDPVAIIQGTPLALMALAREADSDALRSGRVTMSGDTRSARQFQKLLELLQPDWEEDLSRWIGDVAAHRVGNLARDIATWGKDAASRLREDFSEYFTEESRDLPTRTETKSFLDQVDDLRADVDRAEARVRELADRLGDD